jgi:hypothetical protein
VISMDQAAAAKARLRDRLGRPAWLRGIGIGADENGSPVVQVNVSELTAEVRAAIPSEVGGVPVRVDAIGEIEPHRGP